MSDLGAVLTFLQTLRSGSGCVVTPDRQGEHRRQDRDPAGRSGTRPPTLIGFHCLVCGYLRPAEGRLQVSAPMCASSKARTGRQHEPTPMKALFLR